MKLRRLLKIPEGYYRKLAKVESSNNPMAKAKTSSASGLYQFTKGTWKGLTKELGLDYTLDDRFDKEKSQRVVEAFTKKNENYLKNKIGRDPNEAELYLAHFSGMGGASKILQKLEEDPEADASEVFSEQALKANKHLQGKKVYEVYNWAANKFGVENYKVKEETKESNSFSDERKEGTIKVDNTYVNRRRVPQLSTTPINPNYATLPDLKSNTPEKTEGKRASLSKEDILKIVAQENKYAQNQQAQQAPSDYTPQVQEDLSHLYNYINVENYSDGGKYTVKRGDTLSKIARDQGTTISEILKLNNIKNPNNIKAGQDIRLVKEVQDFELKTPVGVKKQNYDYYNDPENIMQRKFVGPSITEEQYNLQELPEIVISTSKEKEKRKKFLKEADKIETKYKDKFETEGININSTNKTPKEIQQFLVDKGYNLNPDNKFKNNGVDGVIGKITKNAIDQYNKDNISSPYTPFKEKTGFLGECTETQCSEYVQNEAFRNINTGESRQDWNNRLGLTGDAWRIGENIVNKGGVEINTKNVQPGDVVTIYTGGNSAYQDQADKAGTGVTHTALVDKVNPDGSYYILHNVHKEDGKDKNGKVKYKGQEYRDLITNDRGKGTRRWLNIKHAFRPNYGNKVPNKVEIREDIAIKGSVKGAEEFIKGLSDNKFKSKIVNRENLDEEEFYSIAKAALGIMGQETEFGDNIKYKTGVKEIGATISKSIEPYIPQIIESGIENFSGKNLFKENEISKGPGSMKVNSNFNQADLRIYNVDEDNIKDPKNAVKATMLKLSRDYKKMIKKGHSKKDALYRAIQLYNGMTKIREEKYADSYDFDYANKVLNFGSQFSVSSNNKDFSTIFDEILIKDKVIDKWSYVKEKLQ